MSVARATVVCVELTAADFERIPAGNLRVLRAQFVEVWSYAERVSDQLEAQGRGDWYLIGVAFTCRWLAGAFIVFNYPHGPKRQPASAPITHTWRAAHEELTDREGHATERELVRHPDGIEGRPGWLEGVSATLRWVWRGSGVPPVDVGHAATG